MKIAPLAAHYESLSALAAALRQGELTPLELALDCHQNIKELQDEHNIFISITDEEALTAAAKQAEEILQNGADQPAAALAGIPYALKDIFCYAGTKTSCGSKILDKFVAPYDATAVAKLKGTGGVMLGKTNMDEFAMGSSNEHSHYGAVANPWDATRVPGGSSGGSAAAVAARLAPYALGTDTGGSVRQPAAFCGITGIKPTYGRVSRYGMVAYASSLDQAGVFAVSAEDAAQVLQAISGQDDNDSTSSRQEVPDYMQAINKRKQQGLKGLKVGLPQEFIGAELAAEIKRLIEAALALLEKEGAEIVPIKLPNLQHAIPCYYTLGLAEASANLARYDGVRYGHRSEDAGDLRSLYVNSRSEGFGAEVKKRILLGTYVLTTGFYDAYYVQAQKVRRMIQQDFAKAFAEVDLIAGPVSPSVAFKLGEKSDPVSMYLQDIYTVPANLAGLPAISLPAGFSDGMPVGLQLLAPQFAEERLLGVGACYQQLTDWHKQLPPLVKQAEERQS